MRLSRGKVALAVAVAAIVALAALAPALGATSVVKAGKNTSGAYVWKPSSKSIPKGDRISWRNPTSVTHNVVAYGGNWSYSRTIAPGDRAAKTFKRRGIFRYRCTIHSVKTSTGCTGMCGRINVG